MSTEALDQGQSDNKPPRGQHRDDLRLGARPPGQIWRSLDWAGVAISLLAILVVSIPTMVVEEDWHGRPMIDQPTHLWILATCLVAGAFVIGGALSGRRRPSAAVRHSGLAACLAVAVLLAGALIRRLWIVHESVPGKVVELWCLGVVGVLVLSLAGSLLGRLSLRVRAR
jgi:hypothetical protein